MFKKFIIAYDHNANEKYINKIKEILDLHSIKYLEILDKKTDNDYPDLAKDAYNAFVKEQADGMILLCGTGIGMNIVANKFDGIRAVLANSEAEAYFSRRHENANTIVFGAGYNDGIYEIKLCRRKMGRMLETFISTDFENAERHQRRVNKITTLIEKDN